MLMLLIEVKVYRKTKLSIDIVLIITVYSTAYSLKQKEIVERNRIFPVINFFSWIAHRKIESVLILTTLGHIFSTGQ